MDWQMRCQVISGLWNAPIRLQARAPTLILCGNIARLGSVATRSEIQALCRDFKTVFWIPYAAETFREDGTIIDSLIVREMINEMGAVCLSNDVIVHEGRTVVATSGWWPGVGGAPNTRPLQAWNEEDRDFVQENCGADTILLTAGSMYCRKPVTLVGGVVPAKQDNLYLEQGRQLLLTNSVTAGGFNADRVFELR